MNLWHLIFYKVPLVPKLCVNMKVFPCDLKCHIYHTFFRGESQRECDNWYTSWKEIRTIQRLPTSPLSSDPCLPPTLPTWEALKGHSFERVSSMLRPSGVCTWLNSSSDLCKPLRFWEAGAESPSFGSHPQQALSPFLSKLAQPIGSGLHFYMAGSSGQFHFCTGICTRSLQSQQYSHDTRVCFWNFLPCALAVCLFYIAAVVVVTTIAKSKLLPNRESMCLFLPFLSLHFVLVFADELKYSLCCK